MKLKKLILASSVAIALAVSSCEKLIVIPETDLIGGDVALKTVTFAEQAIIGIYASMGTEMNIQMNAVFADEVIRAEFYNATTTHEWQYGAADVGLRDSYTAIAPNYTIVNRANVALVAIPKADSTMAGDNAKRGRLQGEALFLRAYAHFELFRYYCGNYDPNGLGMVYMEKSTIDPAPRIKMGEYFAKINADLVAARPLVAQTLADINRANLAAVIGLQARVALYQRNWAAAETFATEYINLVPLASITSFPGIWTDANTAEQAFRLIRTNSLGGRIGSLFRSTSASAANIGQVTWRPANKLWTAFNRTTDVRANSFFRDEPLLTAAGRSSRLIQKYAGTAYGTPNENVANAKVFRTAEMFLIRAEARAELGRFTGSNGADADINTLRANRITGFVKGTYTSAAQAITDIMLERYRELCYEGHRFFDLKRRSLPVQRTPADAPSAAGTTLEANNFRFVLPIPLPEIVANPLMQQNPGYQ
ncbi:MAG: RagB/SusD family nutrient uptake outer membrane protein [Bacteroidetes bacterium]|nr:RagB/SusD family nutrient uptake outer membrane protein [Bacteroidota bacterium]